MPTWMLAQQSIESAISDEFGNLAFGSVVVLIIAIFCITSMVKSVSIERARQATKRELAAYVAEGSIKAEDAIRMLNAGRDMDAKEVIAKSAADGWISAKKADQLIQALEKQNAIKA